MHAFSSAARNWFRGAFAAPTEAQLQAWRAIETGDNVLVVAPTGSGKTLAAFLWAIDRLAARKAAGDTEKGVKILYISPLKALGVDVQRNLRAPLAGIREASVALDLPAPDITVGVRSGDTPASERRRLITNPPDILITTPESLYLLLTSKGAESLATVETVIIDEVHALAGNKRGAHLALSLERLDALLDKRAQRVGLSATVEPPEEVARFLAGSQDVSVVRPPSNKEIQVTVEVPVEDMTNPPMDMVDMVNANSDLQEHRLGSMWPSIERSMYDRILAAKSTIVFTNSRRQAERLTARLNEIYEDEHSPSSKDPEGQVFARAHHGSVSKEARQQAEEELKTGNLRCVVATASLELGIDMGDVDLVILVDPPPSVASGLQRVGRAGHQVGAPSQAVIYPTHRSKLLETAVITQRMLEGRLETMRVLANPLDVLAQQTIAATVRGPIDVEQWYDTVRAAAPFADLPRSAYIAVLDLISGKYPSTEFAALRARVDWDRAAGTLTARSGAQRLAVTSGGTIPDRGMYRVVAGDEEGGTRVGELDEEMVYETRVGEVFTLGTTPWRVRNITRDTVEVEPAFGQMAKTPFWRGDSPSRPVEVGEALGRMLEEVASPTAAGEVGKQLSEAGFDDYAVANALAYAAEQKEAVGTLPGEKTLVVERTRDDVGDWLLVLQSPLGLGVHAPWALAIDARLRDNFGLEGKSVASNDGIIVRLPDLDGDSGQDGPTAADVFLFEPDEIADQVRDEVQGAPVFAARFREAASRALILGTSRPGQRSPLWQQRLRASALLEVAERYPDFPMILESLREVLQDVYDMPALERTMGALARRRMTMVEVQSDTPSPFARSLLFGYVGEFIYSGDTPVGERRIAALSVDAAVLRELLGEVPLAELLEPEAIAQVESELQQTKPGWQGRGTEGVVDVLRRLGPLTEAELAQRVQDFAPELADAAAARHQVFVARIAGDTYFAAGEDAGALVEAAGVVAPPSVPTPFLEAPPDPLMGLVRRRLATSIPVTTQQVATRFGLAPQSVHAALRALEARGEVERGLFLPPEVAAERGLKAGEEQWVQRQVLDKLRSRSLALLRGTVEPVAASTFARFLVSWQYVGGRLRGVEGLYRVLEQLERLPLPASAWETLILPERVEDYSPSQLDELVSSGEVTWVGAGSLAGRDGWVQFVPAGVPARAPLGAQREKTDLETAVLRQLETRGALFAPAITAGLEEDGHSPSQAALAEAIWALVWDGLVTSDSAAALRARISGRKASQKTVRYRGRGRALTRSRMVALAGLGDTGAPMDPSLVGRWSLVETVSDDAVATLWAVEMLERYGVVTRGSVRAEDFPGGFAAAYRLYSDFEMAGTARRGYFIQGLGAAQFALPGAVDELRARQDERADHSAIALAATDPANPYGAAVAWPESFGAPGTPKRNPGAIVVLSGGLPVFYLERGGRTALAEDVISEDALSEACEALTTVLRRGRLANFTLEQVNGEPVRRSPWANALRSAGFGEVPRGLIWRRP